ncbi:CHAT domain-containing protein [Sphingomonas sp. NSE70-1]|uniref:CHAT domain-containing protein n=1 Tax=Sphingomonas caseinilyticus TaxID=2908205 RepID=A0ABT0RUM4_9SPHN|nr:CHAT domain-containing protein [Sphingomonas caseinilyticus]MCL6698695.1 CHAT domain-containing protein [Sphingomonas caseinilyticus]
MTRSLRILMLASAAIAQAGAAETPLSIKPSFRLGDAGVLCTAQVRPTDTRLTGIFDRAYLLTCRDAAGPIGSAIAVRRALDTAREPSAVSAVTTTCGVEESANIDRVGTVRAIHCRDEAAGIDYRRYSVQQGDTSYLVEGLAGYDPALKLALASLVTDRAQSGAVQVATTEVSDPAAFARVQAGALDPAGVRSEAYIRNNAGRFAESAEFFESLVGRSASEPASLAEALVNQGLQQSNLGNFAGAERLLARAEAASPQGDGVMQRLIRNYRAINQLNQHHWNEAVAALAVTVPPVAEVEDADRIREGLITPPLSLAINRDSASGQEVADVGNQLTPAERGAILDAQAMELRGIALRQQGQLADSEAQLTEAQAKILRVRDGRVHSANWLISEIQVERALVAEARGDRSSAIGAFDAAIAALAEVFPESPALLSAKARKAGYLVRSGDSAGGRALFDEVVAGGASIADSGTVLRNLLGPYFDLLARDGSSEAAASMFRASQLLQRPGVAQTQAILARQYSAGNDEGSALFRLALARTREIVRQDSEIRRLEALPERTAGDELALTTGKSSLEALRAEQVKLQAQLNDYPRYKVLSSQTVELAEMQAALRSGEGYYKLMVVGDELYALMASQQAARALKLGTTASAIASNVTALRNSIVRIENGEAVTEPFEVERARGLYVTLFGPVDSEVRALKHLVFEPDGPMLQLPPSLLPATQAGVDAYKARAAKSDADAFDFTGVDWLGRGREVSISVSPRSFLDMRSIAPSRARQAYLGLGENAVAFTRPVAAVADECDWPIAMWQIPIPADELRVAEARFGDAQSDLITGAAFNDSALLGSGEQLDQYRVLHFATHGLVTSPRPDCPPRPALVTSFAPNGSDGLLSFREIFDLKLDADVVILSACDTAGSATAAVSREAGIATGGNYALDGLVRAFVGAGARSVVASHWPVPEQYDATKRLIGGMVDAQPGQALADALEKSQVRLMDDPKTSHPFYWAAFIILGDGAKPLIPTTAVASAGVKPAAK